MDGRDRGTETRRTRRRLREDLDVSSDSRSAWERSNPYGWRLSDSIPSIASRRRAVAEVERASEAR